MLTYIETKDSISTFFSKTESINVSLNLILFKNKGFKVNYLKSNTDTDIVNKLMVVMENDINTLSSELSSLNSLFSSIVQEDDLDKFYNNPIKNTPDLDYKTSANGDEASIYEALQVVIGDFKFLLQNTSPDKFSLMEDNFLRLYDNMRSFVPKSLTFMDSILAVSIQL